MKIGALSGLLLLGLLSSAAAGQSATAVLLSDLHFDPFHDPAKAAQLARAPLDRWDAVLASPDSAAQAAEFARVQRACLATGADSSYALLTSALAAAKANALQARFVTISGDLLVHGLDCRYRAAMKLPPATGDDQTASAAFAAKTAAYVMRRVESTFAGLPVYVALGNNDSDCNHNRLEVRDAFLRATAPAVAAGLIGATPQERTQALATYAVGGYYAATLPPPMRRARILVLDDIYMMSGFTTCKNAKDATGAHQQLAWLTDQLDDARQHGEQVWVLGHVPPVVNPQSSRLFLSTGALAEALTRHADVVRLADFGHTHMDELHLLPSANGGGVPLKVVPAVTPVDGNLPAFTVGQVAPATATLMDYTVFVASNTTGVNASWTKEYSFDATYHEPSFTARSLQDLIGRFRADPSAAGGESQAYQKFYFKGAATSELALRWSAYVCSLDRLTLPAFQQCVHGN